jgi:hypothetical protein
MPVAVLAQPAPDRHPASVRPPDAPRPARCPRQAVPARRGARQARCQRPRRCQAARRGAPPGEVPETSQVPGEVPARRGARDLAVPGEVPETSQVGVPETSQVGVPGEVAGRGARDLAGPGQARCCWRGEVPETSQVRLGFVEDAALAYRVAGDHSCSVPLSRGISVIIRRPDRANWHGYTEEQRLRAQHSQRAGLDLPRTLSLSRAAWARALSARPSATPTSIFSRCRWSPRWPTRRALSDVINLSHLPKAFASSTNAFIPSSLSG